MKLIYDQPSSTWRPMKRSSTKQMQVQMEHRLPGAASRVHHRAVALLQFSFPRQFRCDQRNLSQHRLFFWSGLFQRSKMFLRTNQNMGRRLRINIFKCKYVRIVVNQLRRNLFLRNLAEQTIAFHSSTPDAASSSRMTIVRKPSLAPKSPANFCAACSPETFPARTRYNVPSSIATC